MKDPVGKLAEPLAFLLIGCVALQYLLAIGQILVGPKTQYGYSGGTTTFSAYPVADRPQQHTASLLSVYLLVLLLAAVAVVTVFGVTAHARLVVLGTLVVVAAGALLGPVCATGGLFVRGTTCYGARDTVGGLLGYLVLLGIFVVLGLLRLSATAAVAAAPRPGGASGPGAYGGYGQQQGWLAAVNDSGVGAPT